MRSVLSLLLIAAPLLHAVPSPPSLARLALSTGDVVAPLTAGLQSRDVLTRATAGRLTEVRGERAMVRVLREVLSNETSPDAAREEIRALVLAGTDDDVDFAAHAAARFPSRMDGVLADAIGRLGARGVALYPKFVKPLRRISDESNFFRLALWQSPDNDATPIATALLADADERGWCELIDGAGDTGVIAPAAFATALGATAPEVRLTTTHCLLHRYAADRAHFPAGLRDVVNGVPPDNASPDEVFSRELLHRAAGAEPHESDLFPLLHGNCAY